MHSLSPNWMFLKPAASQGQSNRLLSPAIQAVSPILRSPMISVWDVPSEILPALTIEKTVEGQRRAAGDIDRRISHESCWHLLLMRTLQHFNQSVTRIASQKESCLSGDRITVSTIDLKRIYRYVGIHKYRAVGGNRIVKRGSLGTTHGWSGANMVIWNSTAAGFIVQNPPTAQNWLIGSTGAIIDDTEFGPQPAGYVDSPGSPVTVGGTYSLYDAQKNDSADIQILHWVGGNGNWTDALQWHEGVTPGVYRVSTRDYLVGDIDGFTYDGASSVDAAYLDPAWKTAIQGTSALPITGLDDLTGDKNVAFTIQRQTTAGERVVHGFLALGLKQAAGGDSVTDFVRLFDTSPSHRLNYSDMGWDTEITPTGTFVGVIDLGTFRDQLQTGSVNVQINDDAGLDWAMYVITVTTPIADPIGPSVFIDGGGSVTVDSPINPLRALQIGGPSTGDLRLKSAVNIEINDDFVQLANGTLTVELSATSLTTPSIEAFGEAELAGTLIVQLASGFTPAINDKFEILSALSSVNFEFDNSTLPNLPMGLDWQLVYDATSVELRVIASTIPGDYNQNGIVDTADYVLWRKGPATYGGTDGYDLWQSHFGQTAGSGSDVSANATVPEPATLAMLIFAAAGWCFTRHRAT